MDALQRFFRGLAESYWMACYGRKPVPTSEWASTLERAAAVHLSAVPGPVKSDAEALAIWLRAKLTPATKNCDPHAIGKSFFGLSDPIFTDTAFDVLATWRGNAIGYRISGAPTTPEAGSRLAQSRLATWPAGFRLRVVQLYVGDDRVTETVWEGDRSSPLPVRQPQSPRADRTVTPRSQHEVVPPMSKDRSITDITTPAVAEVAPPPMPPMPATPGPEKDESEREGYIGQVGPGDIPMGKSGKYSASGVLFQAEVEHIQVLKNAPVILQGRKDQHPKSPEVRVFARIATATVGSSSTTEKVPRTTMHLDTTFELEREAYPTDDDTVTIRAWTPKTMPGYRVRWPTRRDLKLMGYPEQGVSIGRFPAGGAWLPYLLPPEALYRSLFVVGGMGGGKTNSLSLIARGLANADPAIYPTQQRPAIVILDAEGRKEYSDLGKDVPLRFRAAVEEAGIGPTAVADFRYLEVAAGKRAFSLASIPPSYTSYFPATLPAKTERYWTPAAERYYQFCRQNKVEPTRDQFVLHMADQIRRSGANASITGALLRGVQDMCWDVFDVPGTLPITTDELLTPGRVSIVDIANLDGHDRLRAAGLALLTLFDAAKKANPPHSCPILLIIDEASRLIPSNFPGASGKEYANKMAAWLSDVLHRGRRAQYGLLLATQYPDDVISSLAQQPQTKISFQLPAKYDLWLKKEFSPEAAERLRNSATPGLAYVNRIGRVEGDLPGVALPPTAIQFPQVR